MQIRHFMQLKINQEKKFRLQQSTKNFIQKMAFEVRSESNLEKAFSIGEWIARFLVMNSCGIYRFDDLEEGLAQRLPEPPLQNPLLLKQEIHIATEVYVHGGHTRLIQNLLDAAGCDADVLLISDKAGQQSILNIHEDRLLRLDAISSVERACQIMEHVVNYRNIFVHIHPDDIISAAALKRLKPELKNSKIIFVNHADHTFSLGLASADIIFEISSYGWALRSKRETEKISSFIGIPLTPPQKVAFFAAKQNLIMSGGDAYKFKPEAGKSFQEEIKFLLLSNKSLNAVIVGPRWHNYWWWPLKLRFRKRLHLKAKIPYKDYIDYLAICSVYLDSYPVTGGTAFTEALTKGCNVAGLVGPINGYGIADELKSENIIELNEFILNIDRQHAETIEQEKTIRERAVVFHSPTAVRQRILQTINAGVLHPLYFSVKISGSEPWFELLWINRSKIAISGFNSVFQVFAVIPVIIKPLFESFGLLRMRLLQLIFKISYGLLKNI